MKLVQYAGHFQFTLYLQGADKLLTNTDYVEQNVKQQNIFWNRIRRRFTENRIEGTDFGFYGVHEKANRSK